MIGSGTGTARSGQTAMQHIWKKGTGYLQAAMATLKLTIQLWTSGEPLMPVQAAKWLRVQIERRYARSRGARCLHAALHQRRMFIMERRAQLRGSPVTVPRPVRGRSRVGTWPRAVSSPARRPPASHEDLPGSLRPVPDLTPPAAA